MKRIFITAAMLAVVITLSAQNKVETNALSINPKANVTIPFSYYGEGVSQPVHWGFDTAWENEQNLRKGLNHMGGTPVDLVRVSFRASGELKDGMSLTSEMTKHVNERCRLADFAGKNIPVAINSDQEAGISDYYKGKPENWVKTIKAHAEAFAKKGHPVVTISPFNEPDYADWNQGSIQDMKDICRLLKQDSYFDGIRISGGNTLNCDRASEWYNYMKDYLDEGNTHQLAGDFNHYADFFQEVRADGKHATADELHNIMEAFVGAEYGMQTGIWWGSAERARGELMQSMNNGVRIGYGESRPTWMAGAVYRKNDGQVKAFIGQSERQATTTTFAFRTDRNVFFDGQGPLREFYTSVTGGTGYQKGTTNGERVYDVTCGEDVQPYIDGTYYVVNRATGHYCLETLTNNQGQQLRVNRYSGKENQQWELHPLSDYQRLNNEEKSLRGGDYSYHSMIHVASRMAPDVWNWSLDESAAISLFSSTLGGNQVYYLQYDSDGYFRLVNQESGMCMQTSSTSSTASIVQGKYNKNSKNQQWRLIPVGIKPEFSAPATPEGFTATAQSASVRLEWNPVEGDNTLAGYTLLRQTEGEEGFETVARGITATAFVDHDVRPGKTYSYKIKSTDTSLNSSKDSEAVTVTANDAPCLVAEWNMNQEDSLYDCSENMNNILTAMKPVFSTGKIDKSLFFNGTGQYAQLPYEIASRPTMTFCAWVKWTGTGNWQRIFDFGNDTNHYMFLTPSNGGNMVFGIKNGGDEEKLTAAKMTANKWVHVAVAIGNEGITLYVDGEVAATSSTITIRPSDFNPSFNYIGRSQFAADQLFKGYMDDIRIYGHALTAQEVADIANMTDAINDVEGSADNGQSQAYDLQGRVADDKTGKQIIIKNGKKIIK